MKKHWCGALAPISAPILALISALGSGLVLALAAAPALAQDISVAVAGPMTGGQATFGRQMKNGAEQAVADINAAGGVLGKKLKLEIGDDACDPKQARSVAEKLSEHAGRGRRRALLLVVLDPGLGRLSRRQRSADHAGLDQSAVHRSRHVEHVPRLRPRRPAGRLRRGLSSPRISRARTSPSSTTRPPTAKVSPTRSRRRSTPQA